jgi:hypothetical protein
VSEQDKIRTEPEEDVEGHRRRPVQASDEPQTEGESEDVEAHRRRALQGSDEPKAEGDGDDDVELHRRRSVS